MPPMRCAKCFYILEHLENHVCPECGTAFDPNDPDTFTFKPPFVWWTYWMPAFALAGGGGGLVWTLLIATVGFTAATTLVVPVAIGIIMGYGAKTKFWKRICLALMATGFALGIVGGAGFLGGLCFSVVAVCAMIPVLFGVLAGWALRSMLKSSDFSQRDYLRSWMLQLAVLLVPVVAALIEGRYPLLRPVSVTTTQIINAPPGQAWKGIQFFEQVRRPVPWLLRVSPSLRPMYTIGHSEKVGDLKTCIYQRGKLTKQITEVIPGKRLAFRVVEQDQIENDGVQLLDGSFDLEPINNGSATRVTLTTRYVPELRPRFAYDWAEALTIHTLHSQVLAGMRDTAEDKTR